MNNLCIIILTFNEEINIKKCLESIKDFADEIIIIDSLVPIVLKVYVRIIK